MMQALFRQQGASFSVSVLREPEVQSFISTHADILDNAFRQVSMSPAMRRSLQTSDYIFSGLKTFHELNEAFPSLIAADGTRKPFEQFLNDVRAIDATYNSHYLRSEYNFATASAEMAARWEQFEQDGDRYYLQYRTVGDDRVRPEHARMHGITLPIADPFWDQYFPPNGWNCRCTVAQVRRSKYTPTDPDEALQRAADATAADRHGMFRFNPGKSRSTYPPYNPYTISRCRDCSRAKGGTDGSTTLARQFMDEGQLCQACDTIRQLRQAQLQSQSHRLTGAQRHELTLSMNTWIKQHLPLVDVAGIKDPIRQTTVEVQSTKQEIFVRKSFFSETYQKNKNNRRLAEIMELATHVTEWLPTAKYDHIEEGVDHNCDFLAYIVDYNGVKIEVKARNTQGLILHFMHIIK